MSLTKRLLMLSALAMVASALVVPASASAQANTGSCVLGGVTGAVDPDIPPAPTTGGAGTYTFQSGTGGTPVPTTCSLNGAVPTASSITSRGRYTNIICGTGTAFGDQTIPGPTPPASTTRDTVITMGAQEVDDVKYTIDFFGGMGLLKVTEVENSPELPAGDPNEVDGIVNIRPAAGSSCTGPPGVSNFDVVGAFTVQW